MSRTAHAAARPSLSRREFGKIVIAGVPLATALGAAGLNAAGQVTFGVATSSFRELPRVEGLDNLDAVLRALHAVQARHLELGFMNIEPAPPNVEPRIGGTPAYPVRIVPTPEQVAATNTVYRRQLREWRMQTGLGHFEQIGAKLAAAGLSLHACAINYEDAFTDEEIEITLRQVTALGASTVSSPMTMATAARLVPFAERHRISIAIHNQVDGNKAGAIATSNLKDALALSQRFKLRLDIGNLTASNRDAVAVFREHQSRVSHVLVKDRLRNGGVSQHFGEGDTPIPGVLSLLKTSESAIPAVVEYDYVGLHSPVEEVAASLAYLTKAVK